MDKDNLAILDELYADYRNVVKPLLSEIEANYQKFPTALLNEIRAFNDHIARCFFPNIKEDEVKKQLEKSKSHNVRMILDCYKYLNVYYSDKIAKFEKQTKRIDLTSIDNGDFYIKFRNLKQDAINKVKYAKREECKINVNLFEYYQNSYNTYVELDDFISEHLTKVTWARAKFIVKRVSVFLLWVLSIILSAILTNNNQEIVQVFKSLLFFK